MAKDPNATPKFTWKQLAIAGAAVVGLAAVIFGMSALSAPKKQQEPAPVTQGTLEAEKLASSADAALSQNQTATALALANKALKADPNNATAKRVIDTAQAPPATETPVSGGQPAEEPAAPPAGPYAKAVKDLGTLLPSSYGTWSKGRVTVQGSDALVTFEPSLKDRAARATVTRAAVYAHDMGSEAKAQAYVKNAVKRPYSVDAQPVRVGIVDSGYFGTNGAGVAAVAFARGRYAFEVVVTVRPGTKPASVKALGVDIASKVPAAR